MKASLTTDLGNEIMKDIFLRLVADDLRAAYLENKSPEEARSQVIKKFAAVFKEQFWIFANFRANIQAENCVVLAHNNYLTEKERVTYCSTPKSI